MCESTVYTLNGEEMEPLFEHLDALEVKGDILKMTSLFGETGKMHGKVMKFSLVDHKVYVQRLPSDEHT
jgi:predicted RNA-binding protein